jgi:CRP-like cAMP-binding protein
MRSTSIRELIGAHPLLADFGSEDLDLIAGCGRNQVFAAGAALAREGEAADRFFLIRKGRASIQVHAPGSALVIATAGPGELVGWSWIFPPYRWTNDVEAVEDTRAVAIEAKCLRDKCERDPAFGYRIMTRFAQVMADQLQATSLRLLDLYGADGAR